MNYRILAVEVELDVQAKHPKFSLPEGVCEFLGVKGEDELDLIIKDTIGNVIFDGTKPLKSGKEIYGSDIREAGIVPGQRIRVEARRK